MSNYNSYTIRKIELKPQGGNIKNIKKFLEKNDLEISHDILFFITIEKNEAIIACGGISEGGIIKCVAIDKKERGKGLVLKLMTELIYIGYDLGYTELFLYTKPENVKMFKACGFTKIETVPGLVVLMENTQNGLLNYCKKLKENSKNIKGKKIGSIVLNTNPFTLGHQYLIEKAASECDWVHIFIVKEDASYFSYRDRFNLVAEGVKHIKNITLHEGSRYIISRATFPTYFLKDEDVVEKSYLELDLKIFRRFIGPALRITHRFVGSEPFSGVTNQYNEAMKYWLEKDDSNYPKITVDIKERKLLQDIPISASRVRELYFKGDVENIKKLVPKVTYEYLRNRNNNTNKQQWK
ncbi:[citrate (pro-3S)-lyase] ligase [Apibacter sp. HY039]|uniref:[citrate (pro-3S)-lyase] ligase n=1 Tax=Apibacter sp. HY039 TaxID=2501476 RepID=UPI000FEB8B08|nr:[citrate (pro-3S)-lyase] ligase [Apibacter sp. HY039]